MADAAPARGQRPPPWGLRLFEVTRLAPAWVGVGLAALLIGGYFGLEAALGAQGPERGREERGVSTLLAMLAFVPTAHFYLGRWTRRNAEALRPLLAGSAVAPDVDGLLRSPASREVGGFSAIVFGVLFLLAPDGPHALARPGYWTPGHAVAWIGVPVLGWMTGRFAHALIHHAQQISRLATDLRRIELLDPAPLAPFVQQGLGGALLVMVMLAVGAAGAVGQEPVLPTVLAIIATLVGVGTAALVLPVLGVRGRVRSEKQRQLDAALG